MHKPALILPFIVAAACALLLTGCSSSSSGSYSRVGASGSYGTGPGHTRPMPQQGKVDLDGVTSVQIRNEKTSGRGCNRDYRVLGKSYEVWNGMTSYIEEGTASWYGPNFHGKKTSMGETYNQKGYSAAHKNLPLPSYLKVTNLSNNKKMVVRVNDRGPFVGSRILDLSEGAARYLGVIGPGTAKVRIEYLNVSSNGTVSNAVGTPRALDGSTYNGPVKTSAPAGTVSSSAAMTAAATTFSTEDGATAKSGWVNSDGWISYDNQSVNRGSVSSKSATATAAAVTTPAAAGAMSGIYVQMAASSDEAKAQEICAMMSRRLNAPVKVWTQDGVSRVLAGPYDDEIEARALLSRARSLGAPDSFIKKF